MTWQAWVTLGILMGVLALLIRGRTAPALVVFGAVILLLVVGVVTPEQALSGFGNPAPFTVAALYVVARAVEKTGGLQPLLRALLDPDMRSGGRRGRRGRGAMARLLFPVAAASAFLNNTTIVAMVAPQVEAWAERRGTNPSRYLMPLSFSAILGGLITVIGTSTTIVVSGLLVSEGLPAIGMFEIARIGLPLALVGLIQLLLLAPILLPDRRGSLREFEEEFREYTVDLFVISGGSLEGKTVEEAGRFGPKGALVGVLLTTILLTELVTNNAAAVLVFPMAMATAAGLGLDPRPFAIVIAVGASASFLTPIGYQTNTMVYGPGGYRFGDYARLGLPLTLLVVILTTWVVPLVWAFS